MEASLSTSLSIRWRRFLTMCPFFTACGRPKPRSVENELQVLGVPPRSSSIVMDDGLTRDGIWIPVNSNSKGSDQCNLSPHLAHAVSDRRGSRQFPRRVAPASCNSDDDRLLP